MPPTRLELLIISAAEGSKAACRPSGARPHTRGPTHGAPPALRPTSDGGPGSGSSCDARAVSRRGWCSPASGPLGGRVVALSQGRTARPSTDPRARGGSRALPPRAGGLGNSGDRPEGGPGRREQHPGTLLPHPGKQKPNPDPAVSECFRGATQKANQGAGIRGHGFIAAM